MVEIHCQRFAANGPRVIEVRLAEGVRRIEAEQIFLDLGTHASLPDFPDLAAAAPLTHVEALELDHVPEQLIVLGGATSGLNSPKPSSASAAR